MTLARRLPKSAVKRVPRKTKPAKDLLEEADASLLELVDHVLNKGVYVTGEAMIGLAGIDLVYLRLTALLCAADRVLPRERE